MSNTSRHSLDAAPAAPVTVSGSTALAAAVHLALTAGLFTSWQPAAHAQAAAPANGQAQEAPATRAWSIPRGPLDAALARFVTESGLPLAATPALVQGRQSQGARGSLSPQAALDMLLAGTGLTAERNSLGEFRLRVLGPGEAKPVEGRSGAGAAGVAALPVVTVRATPEGSDLTEGTGSYTTGSTRAATGLRLSLRETPQSVTVVTRQRMDDQNLNSLGQVLAQVPGLSVSGSSSLSTLAEAPIYSRGYVLNSYQVDGAMASPFRFSWDVDGWYGATGLDMAIYDSVTVVRGATGLLSGAGDPSGSINLVRKRPTETFQASVTGTVGSWEQYRAVADVGGPMNAAGTVRARLVALHDQGRSWVNRQAHDRNVAYGVVDLDLGSSTLLSLALEHHRGNHKGSGTRAGFPVLFDDTGTATPYSRRDNSTADWSRGNEERTVASVALDHRFNEDWQARFRYTHAAFDYGGKYAAVDGLNSDGTITALRSARFISPGTTRSDEWDARLDGRFSLWGRKHDLIIGFNGYRARFRQYNNFERYGSSPVNALGWNGSLPETDWAEVPETDNETVTKQHGLFLNTRLRLMDGLAVILGGRLSNYQTRSMDLLAGEAWENRKESAQFTPYAGVVYDLSRSISAYASYTEIFKPQNYRDASGRFLDPEKGNNVELGLKSAWFGGRLNASAAVFETRKDNLAIIDDWNALGPTGDVIARAEDNTKGRGWELEVSGELAPGWQFQAGYVRIVTTDASGSRLNSAYVPKHAFKLFTTWKPAAVQGLTVGGGVQWQSEINYSSWADGQTDAQLALLRQKSYAVASLLAQYRFDAHWHLSVNLNNVFNKTYRTDTWYHYYGAPRNLQATLRYQF